MLARWEFIEAVTHYFRNADGKMGSGYYDTKTRSYRGWQIEFLQELFRGIGEEHSPFTLHNDLKLLDTGRDAHGKSNRW